MLRRAVPDDARAIAEVQLRGWWHAYGDYVDHDLLAEHTVESRTERWAAILAAGERDPTTLVADVSNENIEEYEISPEDFGLSRHAPDGLLGGDAHLNARILRDVLSGKEEGAARDVVLLNAGAAVYVSGRIAKLAPDSIRLEAPAAIVGVRGTTVAVRIDSNVP